MKRLNVQTSNLVHKLITKGIIQKMEKLGQVRVRPRSRDLLSNFRISTMSLEWVKLETSNLVYGLIARPTNKKAKVGQNGRGVRHLTYFCTFSTPSISVERLNVQT